MNKKRILVLIFTILILSFTLSAATKVADTQFQIHWKIRNSTTMEALIGLYSFGTTRTLQNTTIELVPKYGDQGVCTMYYKTNYIGSDSNNPVPHHFSFTVDPLVNTEDPTNKLIIEMKVVHDSTVIATLKTATTGNDPVPARAQALDYVLNISKDANSHLEWITELFDFYVDLSDALNSNSMIADKLYSTLVSVEVSAP